jgi:hypothetical protein
MTRPFRFGVVARLATDVPTWRDRVRRIADSGYSTLLMPDVPQWQPAPGPTLAFAAALADLRVGTWVYASPVPHQTSRSLLDCPPTDDVLARASSPRWAWMIRSRFGSGDT